MCIKPRRFMLAGFCCRDRLKGYGQGNPVREGALLHFIDLFVPAFLAFIDDRVMAATHRRSDRLDCHDRGWIAAGTILKPHGLRSVRQLGCRNLMHDQRLVLMQEREVSRSSIDIKL
jgi:hypothetical protein